MHDLLARIELDPAWYAALTLAERAAQGRPQGAAHETAVAERARRRLHRWREQAPFEQPGLFEQRLRSDGLAEDDLLELLAEPLDVLRARVPAPPAWLLRLAAAFRAPGTDRAPAIFARPSLGREPGGFLWALEPMLRVAVDEFAQSAGRIAGAGVQAPFEPALVTRLFTGSLLGRVLEASSRTLILELNVARLERRLGGDTPEARFESFVERLRDRTQALALLREYPLLARHVDVCLQNWLAANLEFLARLTDDWSLLRARFSAVDPGRLTAVRSGAGDCHRRGRSVLIAEFESGLRLVYKPRPLAVDVHFQSLLAWVNARGEHPPFRPLAILDRGDYGWAEYVAAAPCATAAEVERFYLRQGGYLALLYVLQATDFHYENLVAVGEHPVLIDLEAVLHPRLDGQATPASGASGAGALLARSVLRSGLLPQRLWLLGNAGLDVSGLAAVGGDLAARKLPGWDGVGTDRMRVQRQPARLPTGQHRPRLAEADVDVGDHAATIAAGFTGVYRTLLRHRAELLDDDGPLAAFAHDEVRVLLRPTATYAELLHESFHPDLLRDGLDRDRFFDRLWRGAEHQPWLARVAPAERRDLAGGDIPMFTTQPAARHLWTSTREVVEDFFAEPALADARRLIAGLGDDDLARQTWLLRASFASLTEGPAELVAPSRELAEPRAAADPERCLAAARAVGDRLAQLALQGPQDAAWLGLTLLDERHWALLPAGSDLYGGVTGVALFLAYLGRETRDERYTLLARKAWQTVWGRPAQAAAALSGVGAFSGWGGILYVMTHLAALWRAAELTAEAETVIEHIAEGLDGDQNHDVIGGAAGAAVALLVFHRHVGSPRALALATRCGERLLAHAHVTAAGTGWLSPLSPHRPLAGFSHGAGGIAWALLHLAEVTGRESFHAAARDAIRYERSLFSPAARNWPDLREVRRAEGDAAAAAGAVGPSFLNAWCHGAPGIGLSRLRLLRNTPDPETRAEVQAAVATTIERGFGGSHCLCHGGLGNLDFLLQAADALADQDLRARAERVAASVLDGIDARGFLCGVPAAVETPGLLVGLSGIGYGLLRLAAPQRVPSVLALQAPADPPSPRRKPGR